MRRALLLIVLLLCPPLAAALSVQDDQGRAVALENAPRRIVSLAPHLTEMLYAIGAGDLLVGTSAYSDYPAEAAQLPVISGHRQVDYERLTELRPQLVLAWRCGNGERIIQRLEELGHTVFVNEPQNLGDVAITLEKLGRLTGREQAAKAAARRFREDLEALRDRYRNANRLSVFYQFWNRPLMTINGEHLISQVIELCGGENVFAEQRQLAPTVSKEAVLAADPQVILASGPDDGPEAWLAQWRRWDGLRAVRENRLYTVPPDQLQRHSPRLPEGAAALCARLDQARRH